MSVTMHLYKPRPDVDFLGNWWMQIPMRDMNHDSLRDLQVKLGGPSEPPEDAPHSEWARFSSADYDWEEEQKPKAWSDGVVHELIELNVYKSYLGHFKGGKRMLNRISKFPSKLFQNEHYKFKYLVMDEVEYRQGWFMKKRFFNRKFWTYYCTTRKEVEAFFKRYVNTNDEWGREAHEAFLNAWEDGMLFACFF